MRTFVRPNFQVEIEVVSVANVDMAEGIIDDVCLALFLSEFRILMKLQM